MSDFDSKTRKCRAGNFLTIENEEEKNQKAIAEVESETLLNEVNMSLGSHWIYQATELKQSRWFHHYTQVQKNNIDDHIWVMAKESHPVKDAA